MKLISKENGKEVKEFSVVLDNICFRRDFKINSRGSKISEVDREYYNCKLDQIIYSTGSGKDKKVVIWKAPEDYMNDNNYNEWLCALQRDWKKFKITDDMIEESKKYGPFLIQR